MSIEAYQRTPEATGIDKMSKDFVDPDRLSLSSLFEGAVLTAQQREEAKAGYSDAKFTFVNVPGARGSTIDDDGKKEKEKDELKNRMFAEAMKTLNLDGLNITVEDALKHVNTLSTHSETMMQQNVEAIRVEENQIPLNPRTGKPFETNEELQAWQQTLNYDPAVQQYSIEDITHYNGVPVSTDGYQATIEANTSWKEYKSGLEDARAAIERGETVDPYWQKAIADVDRNNGEAPGVVQPTVLEQLEAMSGKTNNNLNAGFVPQINAAPTPSF